MATTIPKPVKTRKAQPKARTTKSAPSATARKRELGSALTEIRKPLAEAWKQIDNGKADGYIAQVELAVKAAQNAIQLAKRTA